MTATVPAPARLATGAVRVRGLVRRVEEGGSVRTVIDHLDLDLAAGEFVVLSGRSGSGKSTLLALVGGIDAADAGSIVHGTVDGPVDLAGLDDAARTRFRRRHVGFVFQFFNLIGTLTVLENLRFGAALAGHPDDPAAARDLLGEFGLADRAGALPGALSGGEQQRVAVARALIAAPALILADEPTGNLDGRTAQRVVDALAAAAATRGTTVLMATHHAGDSVHADRVIELGA